MDKNKLGQEPAFASQGHGGISQRLFVTTLLVAAKVSNNSYTEDPEIMVERYYKIADELLKQENL